MRVAPTNSVNSVRSVVNPSCAKIELEDRSGELARAAGRRYFRNKNSRPTFTRRSPSYSTMSAVA
jgi:hypothetical protein